jgi:guanylate kinase
LFKVIGPGAGLTLTLVIEIVPADATLEISVSIRTRKDRKYLMQEIDGSEFPTLHNICLTSLSGLPTKAL